MHSCGLGLLIAARLLCAIPDDRPYQRGGATLRSLTIHRVTFPTNAGKELEQQILAAELKRLDTLMTKEQKKVEKVKLDGKNTIAQKQKRHEAKKLNFTAQTGFLIAKINKGVVATTSETERLVKVVTAGGGKNVTEFKADTKVKRAELERKIEEKKAETILKVNEIQSETIKITAAKRAEVTEINAQAQAQAIKTLADAEHNARVTMTGAIKTVFMNLKNHPALGFQPEDINELEWIDMMAKHSADRLFIDLHKPTALFLAGQQEDYWESVTGSESSSG